MRAGLGDDDYMLDERPAFGPGARGKRAKPYNTVKRQLEKLKPGMWLAVQDRSVTEGDQFWLGQAFAIPNRQGSSCVRKSVVDSRRTRAGRASSVRQATATVGCTFRLPVDIENQILATCW